ncbi:MAG: Bro-N domain-containing protein [Candidatus Contendobacter sp.]|nr:Bro-N domain-containing protein [Candidatus Contendobacter sp.]MDG4556177.1 Bro-N domain-containing protein [Candidatus Contendobacter sp.]
MTALALSFREIHFDVVDRAGQPWLTMRDLVCALYAVTKGGGQTDAPFENAEKALKRLYERHVDEFTDRMTALVELNTAGGRQQVRIFSLRGCHLLAMFARTPVAVEFRRWVLDVLDREVEARPVVLDLGMQRRINQRAWALAQATFDGFRVQMREAARQDPDFAPERWTPLHSQRKALQGVGAMAGLLETTAAMLRARGRELGQQFGEDFDGLMRQN